MLKLKLQLKSSNLNFNFYYDIITRTVHSDKEYVFQYFHMVNL